MVKMGQNALILRIVQEGVVQGDIPRKNKELSAIEYEIAKLSATD